MDDEYGTERMVISIARSVNMGNGEFCHLKVREEVAVDKAKDIDQVEGIRDRYLGSLKRSIKQAVAGLRGEGRGGD